MTVAAVAGAAGKPKRRAPRAKFTAPRERTVQRDIVKGLRGLGIRVISVPNGQKLAGSVEQRTRMAIALRQEGLVAGFPDLMIYRSGSPPIIGLLEIKREGARLTGDHAARQLDCHEALKRDGWRVGIARSLDDALDYARAWGML